jgi:excisionase family DNA binding protein
MPVAKSQSRIRSSRDEDVLTLAEAAAYLRTSESAVEQLAAEEAIPSQKIGGEWRFLKKALDDWLHYPGIHPRELWKVHSRWLFDSPFMDELVYLLEKRLAEKLLPAAPPRPKPGSKEAVLAHFGIFRDENDLEERLAELRKMRQEDG